MLYLEPITDLSSLKNTENMKKLNGHITSKKPVFIFIYWEQCGPCINAKKDWSKERFMEAFNKPENKRILSDKNLLISQVNKDLFDSMENIGAEPAGFPSFRLIHGDGDIEEYNSERNPEKYMDWITFKIKEKGHKGDSHRSHKSKTHSKTHHNASKNISFQMGGRTRKIRSSRKQIKRCIHNKKYKNCKKCKSKSKRK